ncbi:putative anion transporter 2, chloroplastic [Hordeum vulgare]|nr:putative anion transporter 2, chloroplastic [Hordeum vulgare]
MGTEFSLSELEPLSSHLFDWHWLPSSGTTGHSGGILLGYKDATFKVGSMDRGEFFVSMELFECALNYKWEVIVVYGPADHSRSVSFLEELRRKVATAHLPVVVGGDFNLIHSEEDKSNNLVNFPQMHMFNDCIVELGLRELDKLWGANLGRDLRVRKQSLLASIQLLDLHADRTGLSTKVWMHRNDLEDPLTVIDTNEEAY